MVGRLTLYWFREDKADRRESYQRDTFNCSLLQSQKAVSAYLQSQHILPFGFQWQCCPLSLCLTNKIVSWHPVNLYMPFVVMIFITVRPAQQ